MLPIPMTALTFPEFDPVALDLGFFQVRWYALAYLAGILIGWRVILRLLKIERLWPKCKPPMTPEHLDDFLLWATLGIVVGGRLGFVLFYKPDYYLANPGEIFTVWQGGMAFHGGLLGVVVATIIFSLRRNISMFTLGDLLAVVAPIGLFFGRIANFINGELWGRPSDVSWAMIFPDPRAGGVPRHPSQLYEAALEGLVLFAVIALLALRFRAFDRPGLLVGVFFIGYGLARTAVESVRQYDTELPLLFGFLTHGMWLSLPMIGIGLWFVIRAVQNDPVGGARKPS